MKIMRTNYYRNGNDNDREGYYQEDEIAVIIISKGRDNLEDLSFMEGNKK
jgi:hypothetical protein